MRYYTSTRGCYSPNECSSFISRPLEREETSGGPRLSAGAWSPGCSLPGILGYGEACKNPGRGPGSPPPPEASGLGCAASPRTDGCDFSAPARCGSSRRRASGCGAQRAKGLSLCGCCCGFFGPV